MFKLLLLLLIVLLMLWCAQSETCFTEVYLRCASVTPLRLPKLCKILRIKKNTLCCWYSSFWTHSSWWCVNAAQQIWSMRKRTVLSLYHKFCWVKMPTQNSSTAAEPTRPGCALSTMWLCKKVHLLRKGNSHYCDSLHFCNRLNKSIYVLFTNCDKPELHCSTAEHYLHKLFQWAVVQLCEWPAVSHLEDIHCRTARTPVYNLQTCNKPKKMNNNLEL